MTKFLALAALSKTATRAMRAADRESQAEKRQRESIVVLVLDLSACILTGF